MGWGWKGDEDGGGDGMGWDGMGWNGVDGDGVGYRVGMGMDGMGVGGVPHLWGGGWGGAQIGRAACRGRGLRDV